MLLTTIALASIYHFPSGVDFPLVDFPLSVREGRSTAPPCPMFSDGSPSVSYTGRAWGRVRSYSEGWKGRKVNQTSTARFSGMGWGEGNAKG